MKLLDNKEIGLLIKTYRKIKNITQAQLAEIIEIDEKQLGKIERGVHYPSVQTFLKLIKVLEIEIDKFYLDINLQNTSSDSNILTKIGKLSSQDCKILNEIIDVLLRNKKKS